MKKMVPIIVLLAILTSLGSMAVPMQTAREVADNWYENRSGNPNTTLDNSFARPDEQNPAVFVFNYSEGGFVMVSADDAAYPILGYSAIDSAPDAVDQPGARWMYDTYVRQIEEIREANPGNSQTRVVWDRILANDFSAFGFTRDVSPLISTTWNQDYPYNADCPTDYSGPGGHVYAGCGATTMGQIMRYWEHPEQGTGSHSYTHPQYGTISADFESTTYNWNSMPNSIYSYDADIAELLFHCGVAVNMDYGPDGSGSNSIDTQYAFATYFGYQHTLQRVIKDNYSDSVWNTMLINELEEGRPVFYAGYGEFGHAFVLDGYEGTTHFHFNFGWSGSYNGYYYLNNLNPGYYNFTNDQEALVNIQPETGPSDGDPPTNLTATVVNGVDVELTWQAPTGDPGELRWDDGFNDNGIGTNNAVTFDVAIRFDTDDLAPFNGLSLTEISFFPRYEDCDYAIKVWTGGSVNGTSADAGDLIVNQPAENVIIEAWNTYQLDEPVEIPSDGELWFGYHVDTEGGHPAGCDAGAAVEWKGNLIYMNGWNILNNLNPDLNYNWNLVGLADNGRMLTIRNQRDLTGYKIYRDGAMIHEIDGTNTLSWTDEGLDDGEYTYWVTAVYNDTEESVPSNTASAVIEANYPPPANLTCTVNAYGVLMDWQAPDVDPEPYESIDEGFEEGGLPDDWSLLDLDGDGIYWEIAPGGFFPHSGEYCMASASFINEVGALTPNNWLITPQINLYDNAFMAFHFAAQDYEWPEEHMEVRLSTTTMSSLDFTELLFEGTPGDDHWHQIYLDLSDYANETVYIAFIHNEVTDMYWLKLDDIYINSAVREIIPGDYSAIRESRKNDGFQRLTAAIPPARNDRDRPDLIRYNIYRNDDAIDTQNPNETNYTDTDVPSGYHTYYVTAVYDGEHESMPSNMVNIPFNSAEEVPEITTNLAGNHPNPFNPVTQIDFSIATASQVTIEVFNLKGQLVRTLANEKMDSGHHTVRWIGDDDHGKPVGSGVFFYRMKAGDYTSTKKMLLLK